MSSISFELELCQTTTSYESLQTCIGMIRKKEDNQSCYIEWVEFVVLFIAMLTVFYFWKKK